ncbi:hypothetical protein GCM10017083_41920 [Thalassobaculum fulvum]|uniref:PAS domain-containing protein n=1 Tax=Thalassobaculum fulvum TaxID=1633335 RepID=A0A918XV52_9PROT|nr:PAS domain-containing protein [Thalassobaculum fulvum]GHD58648.1 hypothetical protein GCM10017083_41920 [Thalassobaculum fulvum]
MTVDPSTMGRPELRALLAIWEARRDGADLPRKVRFAPVDVSEFMANMLFVEVSDSGPRFRYREVGVELTRIYGRDVTDRYLDQMPVLFRRFAEPAYREVLATRDATYGSFRFVRNWWIATYERLMLPLAGDDGVIVEVAVAIYPRFTPRGPGRRRRDA